MRLVLHRRRVQQFEEEGNRMGCGSVDGPLMNDVAPKVPASILALLGVVGQQSADQIRHVFGWPISVAEFAPVDAIEGFKHRELRSWGITTAFTCRAGCKERDVSKNRHAGPVKCNALVRRLSELWREGVS